ncbi:hypothetical protein [Corynebacterium tuberculostearicum]|uniref:hypothetical protein n=1 Tax=Corynebacterium tuberculostearicum TaxID=38304 RepID=UPI0015C996AA|nr:hypothetical protein [Corynebacterium tuberculostearicum]NYI56697.1 hypothetical protein [Corynebacterium tuberculostearicum]QQU80774.1 hypothetical protein I6I74_05715 [Corynebacterium tuberculostearicum]
MDISRSLPRKRWTLLTAILATIAVIAALLTVPLNKASAAEPTDFEPDTTLGSEAEKSTLKGHDKTWDGLVWAGTPQGPAASKNANPNNNVGWAWCIEPGYGVPYETTFVYDRAKAEKLNVNRQYRDAAIILARKIESAVLDKDYEAASTYRTYLIPFVARDETSKHRAATTITGEDPTYTNKYGKRNFPGYKGSYEEFKKLTGYEFVKHELYGYKTDLKKFQEQRSRRSLRIGLLPLSGLSLTTSTIRGLLKLSCRWISRACLMRTAEAALTRPLRSLRSARRLISLVSMRL